MSLFTVGCTCIYDFIAAHFVFDSQREDSLLGEANCSSLSSQQ